MPIPASVLDRRAILGLAALLALAGPAPAQEPPATPLAVDDLYRLESIPSVRHSPDGSFAVYVRQWIDRERGVDRFALGLAREGEPPRSLEPGEPDGRGPVLSPDGRWVAFVSTRPRPDGWEQTPGVPPESDAAVDLWLIPAGGGRPIPLAGPDKPYGRVFHDTFYGRVAFSPDGRRLAFVADDGVDPRTEAEVEADVVVVRPDGGEGYTGYRPAQVWVADLAPDLESAADHAAAAVRRLTDDDVWYGDPQWSPDGRTLVVHANRTDDREAARFSINKDYDLWALDAATGALTRLTSGPGPEVSPRFSPDGRRLACLSVPRKGTHMDTFNLAVVTLGDGGASTRVLFDHHGPGADDPPHPYASYPLPDRAWDGPEALIYTAPRGLETATIRVDLATGRGAPVEGRAEAAGRASPPPVNAFLAGRLQPEVRTHRWDNGEGRTIEGLLTLPPESVARAPYPVVLYPHGGPHSRTARGFDLTAQVLAGAGYAVFQPNFRGSAGYGQAFIDADRGDFGGGDQRDVLTGLDDLIRQGLVDPARQFVYGVSYGGYMTTWLVGQTGRFRAAVAQNAVTDLTMMWGLSDIPSWTDWEFGGRPWEVPGPLRDRSPLTHVGRVETPTLILHSRDDRRCPLPMGVAYHNALRRRGVPTAMVIYPGEPHGIRQPRHREDVLRRILDWFARHDPGQTR